MTFNDLFIILDLIYYFIYSLITMFLFYQTLTKCIIMLQDLNNIN